MFIQIMQGKCTNEERMHQLSDEWRETMGPTAEGWLGGTYGVTDDGEFLGIVRFESREAAARNSARPEQDAWWQKMQECFEYDVTFHDCDDVMLMLDGGSDEAGLVQVMQGRATDPEKFHLFNEQPMDALHEQRPDIIGGTIAMQPDGWFTETIFFRSEEAAREGERKEMPEDMRKMWEEEMSLMQDLTYKDLHHPWFASRS